MELLDRIADITEDETQAAKVLGLLFMVIRFTMQDKEFKAIHEVVPQTEEWIRDSMSTSAGRTGEILAWTDPANVRDRILATGCTDEQLHRISAVVTEALGEALDQAALDTLKQRVPVLSAVA